ncbi:hypothetical protein N7532_000665 [Penicillium argentinense]|uniref:N-acetyltransferase domain-containing protein n=1 Tax=Penicillium argentinense TaxID=1131581 RepID=A0A9W9KNI8_9EURO|nr:uncharacterized protein N7532_000665 [Penicillium argentinense]KAJ5112620.1 hypothetical protein N7532_000665 [Penicillium argentinense]
MPIHYNIHTKEPYLRLPEPLSNIIITPHRLHQLEETIDAKVPLLNDPIIYLNLTGPPYPYLREHEEEWVKMRCEAGAPVLNALRAEFETSVKEQQFFDFCPFSVIREVTEQDPTTGDPLKDILIGDVGISRYSFYEYEHGSEEKAEAQRLNDELPAGDERIVWQIGDFMAPSHHGRGIMTQAMRMVLQDWGVPRMNIKLLKAGAFVENIGSIKVFEKNNFKVVGTLKDWVSISESRGGGRRSLVLVKWKGL